MNLLAKKRWVGPLWVVAIIIFFGGCKEDLGIELPPDAQNSKVKFAEFTLPISNVYYDSLRTDKRGVIIVGSYSDPLYGDIYAEGYTHFSYRSGALPTTDSIWVKKKGGKSDVLKNLSFGGARLVLDVERALSSSELCQMDIQIHTLVDTIFSQGIYLRGRQLNYSDLVGSATIEIDELDKLNGDSLNRHHPVAITLTEEYSTLIRDLYEDSKITATGLGLRISASTANGLMSYDILSDTSEIQLLVNGQLYDTATNTLKKDTTVTTVRFRLNPNNHFTHVSRDRSGSTFSTIADRQDVQASVDFGYMNELAGIFPKIDLTPFLEFAEGEGSILINRAEIIIPVQVYDGEPVPDFLSYYFADSATNNINWSAFANGQFYNTVLQQDRNYYSPVGQSIANVTAISDLNSDYSEYGYKLNAAIFFQFLYERVQADQNNVPDDKRRFLVQSLAKTTNLVIQNGGRFTPGRASIILDGVKLRIFYTAPN